MKIPRFAAAVSLAALLAAGSVALATQQYPSADDSSSIGSVVMQCAVNGRAQPCTAGAVVGNPADDSANQPSLTGLNLLSTVAASPARVGGCEIQNQSTNLVTLAFDQDVNSQLTVLELAPASTSPGQGGGYTCSFAHQGRIRVYGTAGSQVAVRVW